MKKIFLILIVLGLAAFAFKKVQDSQCCSKSSDDMFDAEIANASDVVETVENEAV